MSTHLLFDDVFQIGALNVLGKKFERVDRLHGKSVALDMELILDVNSELFQCYAGDRVQVLLAASLTGGLDDGVFNSSLVAQSPLAQDFDYIMHGRVFSLSLHQQRLELQASFGGLLLRLRGDQAQLDRFAVDNTFYLLMKNLGGHEI